MEHRDLSLGAAASEKIRAEISRAGGNEVCFIASLTDEGEVIEPRVVARGNSSAVLAAIRSFRRGNS